MNELEFKWIEPAKIREHWSTVKTGVQRVEKFTDAWIAEDIYMSLKTGVCQLHIVSSDGDFKGFVVTQFQENYGANAFHVWIAYSVANDFAILKKSVEQIKEWAKSTTAEKVTFSSTRRGWTTQAKKLGFNVSPLINYEMRLE